jgi:hypothetical protein
MASMKIIVNILLTVGCGCFIVGIMRFLQNFGVNETESAVAILVMSGYWMLSVKESGEDTNAKAIVEAIYSRKSNLG